jgi:5-dehydro-2-deoxygluconokinase
LRRDEALNHIHWATTRRSEAPTIMALAIDHRAQLEKIADAAGSHRERISDFKLLAVEAAAKVAAGRPGYGMLLDGKYGREALFRAVDHGFWIGRPVEEPGSRPLEFESGGSLGAKLVEWPIAHTIKCLCFYHPDDPPEMKVRQERELLRLYDAARRLERELLIEIIASKNGPIDDRTVARVIERLYEIDVKPDWWKLESQPNKTAWDAIARAIETGDPLCRGVLLLGLEAPEKDLAQAFALAHNCAVVKGFAVGRTIFAEPAAEWFAGRIDDREAVERMAAAFQRLSDRWREGERTMREATIAPSSSKKH